MPRGQATRTRQLSLDLGRALVERVTAANRARHVEAAQAQLARCEAALARQRQAEQPRWRRCEACFGREDVTAPHSHAAA